ncbi:hypothetical protein QUB70_11055 [Microcoleus sp. A003_D6]|uniref:hypothetical protein n=1 Tax=Microcoleus sp. A003_D6 TaxID=3055266 RepID=UPI002FD1CE37
MTDLFSLSYRKSATPKNGSWKFSLNPHSYWIIFFVEVSKVLKILGLMATNLRHPSLKTHKYHTLSGSNEEEVFEACVEKKNQQRFEFSGIMARGKEQSQLLQLHLTLKSRSPLKSQQTKNI